MSSQTVTTEEAARIIIGEMRNICNNDIKTMMELMDLIDGGMQELYANMTVIVN